MTKKTRNYTTKSTVIHKHTSLSKGNNAKKRFKASSSQTFQRTLLEIQRKLRRNQALTKSEQKFVIKFGYRPTI